VGVDLESVLDRELCRLGYVLDRLEDEASALLQIHVGLEQPGTVGPEGAIDLALDRAHREEVVPLRDDQVVGQPGLHLLVGCAPHHHVEADRQRVLGRERLEEVDRVEGRPGVLERRHSLRQRVLAGQLDRLACLRLDLLGRTRRARLFERPPDEALCRLTEQAGRLAVCVAHEGPALRVRRVLRDSRHVERAVVGECRVSARVSEQHGVVGRDGAQRVVQRHAIDIGLGRLAPLLLVPAAPQDPLARLGRFRRLGHHRHDVVPRLGLREVEAQLRHSKTHEVTVPLDEPGDQQAPVEFDDLCRLADQRGYLFVASDRDDLVAAHRDGRGDASGVVDCRDLAAAQHEIGLFRGNAWGSRESARHHRTEERALPRARAWSNLAISHPDLLDHRVRAGH